MSSMTGRRQSRFRVTKIEEKVHLMRKYKIKWAVDPSNGRKYSINEMLDASLIDKASSMFCVPSTNEKLDMDEAIRSGIVFADLIDEFIETSNESFEYVEESESISRKVNTVNHQLAALIV